MPVPTTWSCTLNHVLEVRFPGSAIKALNWYVKEMHRTSYLAGNLGASVSLNSFDVELPIGQIGHFRVTLCYLFKSSPHAMVLHENSFWHRGKRQLENGLFDILNCNLAPRLRGIKQKKSFVRLVTSMWFLWFYFPKPRSQIRTLIYQNWPIRSMRRACKESW